MRARLALALVVSLALVTPFATSVGADEPDHAEHAAPGIPIGVAVMESAQLIDSDGGGEPRRRRAGRSRVPQVLRRDGPRQPDQARRM